MFLTQIRSRHTQIRIGLFLIRIGPKKSPYKFLYVKICHGKFFFLFLREGPALDCA